MNLTNNNSKLVFLTLLGLSTISCNSQTEQETNANTVVTSDKVDVYYQDNVGNDLPSKSNGSVSNGSLENGKLIPFSGDNYQYFDTTSYMSGRGFMNNKVKSAVLETYEECIDEIPDRRFYIMECSSKNGGNLFPHKTHQNGLSIDFMMPLKQNDNPYYGLDSKGFDHYLLEFDYDGKYLQDPTIEIDFEVIAHHLLILEEKAQANGLHIKKIIIHTELKDELYKGKYGQQLKASDIYVVKALTPLINALHDDHYHVDFELK